MYHTCTCILLLGSRPHVTSLLVKLQELAECEEQLKVKNSELHQVNTRINQLETTAKRQVFSGYSSCPNESSCKYMYNSALIIITCWIAIH